MQIQGTTLPKALLSPYSPSSHEYEPAARETTAQEPASAAADEVLDLSNMTPNQMQGIAKDLWKSGKIDLTQLLMLQTAGMPLGRVGPQGEFIHLTEAERESFGSQPVNYPQIVQNALDYLEQSGRAADPTSGYKSWQGIQSALEQLSGINTYA
jgi:hypothetical protein